MLYKWTVRQATAPYGGELAKVRPPEDRPTEEQVEELLLRMKRRWGLA